MTDQFPFNNLVRLRKTEEIFNPTTQHRRQSKGNRRGGQIEMGFDRRDGLPCDPRFSGKIALRKTLRSAKIFQVIFEVLCRFCSACLPHDETMISMYTC